MVSTWYNERAALGVNECGTLSRTVIFRAIWIKDPYRYRFLTETNRKLKWGDVTE